MKNRLFLLYEALRWPAIVGIAYYVMAALSLYYTMGQGNIAAIWPPSGILFAALIFASKRSYPRYLAAAIVASMVANLGAGTPLYEALMFTFANVTESVVAIYLLKPSIHRGFSFVRTGQVLRFCYAAFFASLWSAALSTILTKQGGLFFLSWMTTVLMGILIVTPMVVTIANLHMSQWLARPGRRSRTEVTGLLILVAIVTGIVFSQTIYPLLFLPPVFVLAATYRLGPAGAASSILIVAVIGTFMTGHHTGPIYLIQDGPQGVIFFLQFYLLTILISAMPLAALLTTEQRLIRRLDESNQRLLQAEAAAQVGHWRANLTRQTLFWSREIYRIHGLAQDYEPNIHTGLEKYHPEDRERVENLLKKAALCGEDFEYEARILRPSGEIRHVHSRGRAEQDGRGRTIGLFGTIQDITHHVESALKLEAARYEAEVSARKAQAAANTDSLTNLPNRRHALRFLDDVIADAQKTHKTMSVAMFDIDHFKSVNDRFGHAAGDDILISVANSASAVLRNGDLIGRFGGEEFIVILPGASAGAAMAVSERIRCAVEANSGATSIANGVTVSIGVAEWERGKSGEELLHRVDAALYAAKDAGRNMLRLAA